MNNAIIRLENLNKSYFLKRDEFKALKDINMEVDPGEFIMIMGKSGSGKTTLMNILSFLDNYQSGKFIFMGEDTSNFDEKHRCNVRNQHMGFVFQQFHLIDSLNVFQNILKDAAKNPKEAAFIVKFGMGYKMSERRRKYYKEKGEKVPKVLVGSLNSNCNFFCRGCYRRNNTKIIEEKENTLSRGEWRKILRRAKDLGVISFVFAGGEPLKRKDILYEAAKVKSIIFPTFISLDSIFLNCA